MFGCKSQKSFGLCTRGLPRSSLCYTKVLASQTSLPKYASTLQRKWKHSVPNTKCHAIITNFREPHFGRETVSVYVCAHVCICLYIFGLRPTRQDVGTVSVRTTLPNHFPAYQRSELCILWSVTCCKIFPIRAANDAATLSGYKCIDSVLWSSQHATCFFNLLLKRFYLNDVCRMKIM